MKDQGRRRERRILHIMGPIYPINSIIQVFSSSSTLFLDYSPHFHVTSEQQWKCRQIMFIQCYWCCKIMKFVVQKDELCSSLVTLSFLLALMTNLWQTFTRNSIDNTQTLYNSSKLCTLQDTHCQIPKRRGRGKPETEKSRILAPANAKQHDCLIFQNVQDIHDLT